MDEFTKIIQNEAFWYRTFADDVVLVVENAHVLEGKLERQREVLEKNELKLSRAKTEFLELRFINTVRDVDVWCN